MDNKHSDNTNRQTSRSTANVDAIDCIVNTYDLDLESDVVKQDYERQRGSTNSRRDHTSKRSKESSLHRSTRHSPSSSSTRKGHSNSRSISSSLRSYPHYHQSQRHHRIPSISPSPPPQSTTRHHRIPSVTPSPPSQSTSRHHRSTRPIMSTKRAHSRSRSPNERRPPIHRLHPETSKEIINIDINNSTSLTNERTLSNKIISNKDTTDLSFVSEDESTKIQSNSTTIKEQSPVMIENRLDSTSSISHTQSNPNENSLETSNLSQDHELSLFPNSLLSTTSTNSTSSDLIQTIDLISKYKTMQAMPYSNSQIENCSKEILMLIQKQIQLQKIELNYREREIKLRERELVEREKNLNEKSNDTILIHNEEKFEQKTTDQDMKDVSEKDSIETSMIPSTSETSLTNKNDSDQLSVIRKNGTKSRFSPSIIDPSLLNMQQNSIDNRHSDICDNNQSSIKTLKKPTIPKILPPNDSTISIVDTDLKVTSSNSCRKVEFQSGNIDKTVTSKGSSHDLRLTLSKNRTKHLNNDDDDDDDDQDINDIKLNDDNEPTTTSNRLLPSQINTNKDDKQQSHHDYHQQRSVTSTSIETMINDKRDNRRHQYQRNSSSRQQQYSGPSSTSNSKERSYIHESTSQQTFKYGSNQKRHENDDLRSRLFDPKRSKSSRTTHRNNQ